MAIKILHLRSSGGIYGAEQVILNLARTLDTLGCVNHIVCINNRKNPHTELVEQAQRSGLKASVVDCKGAFDAKAIDRIRVIIREEKVDLIHCHDYKACIFGLSAAKSTPVKKIATNHLWTRANLKLRLYEFVEGLNYNRFDRVVAVSREIEKECRPFLFKKEKLTSIPNGIDLCRFALDHKEEQRRSTRGQLGLKENDIVIGNIARLSIEKDQASLLRAFCDLTVQSGKGSFKLLIAGDGPERSRLESLANELNIKDRCLFLGVRQDVPQILNSLDVYVQSSKREGLPMILLEAMASFTPIVSTRAGGIPQVIHDGQHGLLVDIADVGALQRSILKLVTDKSLSKNLAGNAGQLVEREYSAKAMAAKYYSIYKDCLK